MTQLVRYFIVGGLAALVDFLLFAALLKFVGLAWYYASVVSFNIATIVNYLLSIHLVFESETRYAKQHEIALVFIVSGVGLVLNQATLYVLVSLAGLNVLGSKIGATGFVFFWNFLARQKFIFGDARLSPSVPKNSFPADISQS